MSRKDYIALAKAMNHCQPPLPERSEYRQWYKCCQAIADAFASDNNRFDEYRFFKACGVNDNDD